MYKAKVGYAGERPWLSLSYSSLPGLRCHRCGDKDRQARWIQVRWRPGSCLAMVISTRSFPVRAEEEPGASLEDAIKCG